MPARSTQVGIRTFHDTTEGLEVLTAPWLHRNGIAAALEVILARAGDAPVYLSLRHRRARPGLRARAPARRCRAGSRAGRRWSWCAGSAALNLVGMDMVEVSPPFDHAEITALAAAHLAHDWLCLLAARPARRDRAAVSAACGQSSCSPAAVRRRVHRPPAGGLSRLAGRPAGRGGRVRDRRHRRHLARQGDALRQVHARGPDVPADLDLPPDHRRRLRRHGHRQPVDRVRHGAEARLRRGDGGALGRRHHAAGDPQRRGPERAAGARWRRATC